MLYCFARLFSSEAKETEDAHVGCEGGKGGGGEAIILSTGDKCEYNLSYYFLDSGNEYREEITMKQKISSEVYSDEFEGRKKYNLILKITKSQQNGNVCRLIVSKSVLIKHVSRGEVF